MVVAAAAPQQGVAALCPACAWPHARSTDCGNPCHAAAAACTARGSRDASNPGRQPGRCRRAGSRRNRGWLQQGATPLCHTPPSNTGSSMHALAAAAHATADKRLRAGWQEQLAGALPAATKAGIVYQVLLAVRLKTTAGGLAHLVNRRRRSLPPACCQPSSLPPPQAATAQAQDLARRACTLRACSLPAWVRRGRRTAAAAATAGQARVGRARAAAWQPQQAAGRMKTGCKCIAARYGCTAAARWRGLRPRAASLPSPQNKLLKPCRACRDPPNPGRAALFHAGQGVCPHQQASW